MKGQHSGLEKSQGILCERFSSNPVQKSKLSFKLTWFIFQRETPYIHTIIHANKTRKHEH